MNSHDIVLFFVQILLMLATAMCFGRLAQRYRLPVVLGELVGGILLGPTFLGLLAPQTYGWLFPSAGNVALCRDALIRLGMLFFLFTAGLEVNLERLRGRGLSVMLTSLLGIAVPFGLGVGVVELFPRLWGEHIQQWPTTFALFMGAALSISALPVIIRVLMDLGLLQQKIGLLITAAATIDDLVGWTVFAILLSVVVRPGGEEHSLSVTLTFFIGFAALLLTVGRWSGRRLLNWLQRRGLDDAGFLSLGIVVVLGAAAATEAVGIHAIFGAFMVGVALANRSGERRPAHDVIYRFAISFFAPLYFVSIGLKANFAVNFDVRLAALVLLVACLGKIGGAGLGAWLGGNPPREALAIGFGMNARGAMEIILASVALESRLIDQRIFVALIFMALITSILSAPVMQRLLHNMPAPRKANSAKPQ